jgi:PAS domain S-box-containing protein
MEQPNVKIEPLRVLYLEDSPRDAEIVREILSNAGYEVNMDCVEHEAGFSESLRERHYDLVLSDFSLPGFDAFGALKLSGTLLPDAPFICVSGSIGEETAIELLKQGAVDYVLKDRLVRLPFAVKRAVEKANEERSRHQAEEALRRTEIRLRSYFELSSAGIAITSPEKGWLEVNDHLCEMLGYHKSELFGKTWPELTHPEDLNVDLDHFNRILSGEQEGYSIDKRFIRKDGGSIWVNLSVRCVRREDGKADYFIALMFDISDRKKAEEKIRENEEKYRSIFQNSSAGILLTTPDGSILEANDFACALFGMTEEELRRSGRGAIVDASDPRLSGSIDERMRLGRAQTELTFVRRDGSKFEGHVSSTVFSDSAGNQKTSMIIQDLTERKRAEEEILFRNIVLTTQQEASVDGILVVDRDSRIVSHNRRFLEMWGFPEGATLGLNDEEALQFVVRNRVADPEGFLSRVREIYSNVQSVIQDEFDLADGRVFSRYTAPMVGPDGRYFGRVWYFTDITERKRAEAQIRKDLKVKEVMLREIHHRVRNNLNVISSLLNLQSERIVTKKQALDAFVESKNRIFAMALVHSNLYKEDDFSSIQMQAFAKNLTDNLMRVYRADVEIRIQADALSLDINTAVPCGLILNELVTNSLKHAFPERDRGIITIGFERTVERLCRMTVQDNGVGLPPAFDPARSKSLGFTIVSQLVAQIDGEMTVRGNAGARFEILFPAAGAGP